MSLNPRVAILGAVIASACAATPAHAIIVYGDQGRNTDLGAAPADVQTALGYQGRFGSFMGTPIAPRYFATANHIGDGGSGGTFTYNDGGGTPITYHATLAGVSNDLALWQIDASGPAFTHYAPLYTGGDDTGKQVIMIGRGTQRGGSVAAPSIGDQGNRGWYWGSADGQTSWGRNVVTGHYASTQTGFEGDLTYFDFNNNAGADEGIFSSGDSGGAVFILDTDNTWKLDGINSLVDGPWSTQAAGPYFNAALFNAYGFYTGSPTDNTFIGPNPDPALNYTDPTAAASYVTTMSTRLDFIGQVTGLPVPEPASLGLLGLGALALGRRRPRSPE